MNLITCDGCDKIYAPKIQTQSPAIDMKDLPRSSQILGRFVYDMTHKEWAMGGILKVGTTLLGRGDLCPDCYNKLIQCCSEDESKTFRTVINYLLNPPVVQPVVEKADETLPTDTTGSGNPTQ